MSVWTRDGISIDDDPARLDLDVIHGFLSNCYWSPGIPREAVARAIAHSMPFGLYDGDRQIGFARLVTDRMSFAWLADVFVLDGYRGRGLARWLVATILAHPELTTIRRWMLATRDAHGVYAAVGFTPLDGVERYMSLRRVPPWALSVPDTSATDTRPSAAPPA